MGRKKSLFVKPKRRYMMVTKCKEGYKDERKVFHYNIDKIEIMYDAYWMLEFGHAERVTIRSTKNRKKILVTITSVQEWESQWFKMFGYHANYFVFADRIKL